MEASPAPERIPIAIDDHYANRIGSLDDGRQFIITNPFVAALGSDPGREFLAVYLFDGDGKFLEARIDDLGIPSALDEDAARKLLDERIAELGAISYGDIEVQPFSVERFGTAFGLIPRPPEDEDDQWAVEMQPWNYMAFFEPWEGDYDT